MPFLKIRYLDNLFYFFRFLEKSFVSLLRETPAETLGGAPLPYVDIKLLQSDLFENIHQIVII